MKPMTALLAALLFLAGAAARAEYRQIELTVFGMD